MKRLPESELDRLEKWLDFQRWANQQNQIARPADPILKLLGLMVCGIAGVITLGILGVAHEWAPGSQDEVARQYRAQRHEAISVEVVAR